MRNLSNHENIRSHTLTNSVTRDMLVKACTNGLGYKWFINISILLSQLKIYIGLLYYKHIAMLPQENFADS